MPQRHHRIYRRVGARLASLAYLHLVSYGANHTGKLISDVVNASYLVLGIPGKMQALRLHHVGILIVVCHVSVYSWWSPALVLAAHDDDDDATYELAEVRLLVALLQLKNLLLGGSLGPILLATFTRGFNAHSGNPVCGLCLPDGRRPGRKREQE